MLVLGFISLYYIVWSVHRLQFMQLLSIPFRLVSIHSAIFANMLHIRTKYSRRFPINFHACFIHSTNIYQAPKFLYARNYFMYWPFGRQSRLSCSCNFCAHFPANNLSTNSRQFIMVLGTQ